MAKFRAVLKPRLIGEHSIAPDKHNPTVFKSTVLTNRAEYDTFMIDGKSEEATLEGCAKIKAAVQVKYGQDLVDFEPIVSAAEAAEFEEFRRHKAAQAAKKPAEAAKPAK